MMTLKIYLWTVLILIGIKGHAAENFLTLAEVEELSLQHSDKLKFQQNEMESAKNKITSSESNLYPRLSLEGSYRHVSEVPSISFPTGQSLAFGDNKNYSIGPQVTLNLLDFGQTRYLIKASESTFKSKEKEMKWFRRQVLLLSRVSYLKTLLKFEQLELTKKSLKLAESQYRDILNKSKAGTANRIDLLSANKEVNNFKLQVKQLAADYQNGLQDLAILINDDTIYNKETKVKLEPSENLGSQIIKNKNPDIIVFNPTNHPLIESLDSNAEAMNMLAESQNAVGLPKVSLFAKTSIDYPNGPRLEKINQNTIGLNVSIPLYEGRKSTSDFQEKHHTSLGLLNKKDETIKQLNNEFQKNIEQIKALREKTQIYQEVAQNAEEKARLVYDSYSAGKLSFIEVQSANLQMLESKIQSSFNQIQLNIYCSQIASFVEDK